MARFHGKITAAVAAASALVFVLAGCSDDGGSSQDTKERISSAVTATQSPRSGEALRSSIEATASSVVSGIGGAWDNVKLTTFVAAFRTAYPNLSSDRADDSIELIVKETCTAIDAGASTEQQVAKVTETATNHETVPTSDQANRILQMVKPTCP